MSRYCRAKQIGPQGIFPLPMSMVLLLSHDRVRAGPLISARRTPLSRVSRDGNAVRFDVPHRHRGADLRDELADQTTRNVRTAAGTIRSVRLENCLRQAGRTGVR